MYNKIECNDVYIRETCERSIIEDSDNAEDNNDDDDYSDNLKEVTVNCHDERNRTKGWE